MEALFLSFVLTSCIGTATALLLAVIRPVTRKMFSAAWHYYMWLCVILVMLVPVSIDLPEKAITNAPLTVNNIIMQNQQESSDNTIISVPFTAPDIAAVPQTATAMPTDVIFYLSVIWLAVAIALFLIKAVNYVLFIKRLHKFSVPSECPELSAYTKRRVSVRISNKISSPLMTGIIKPTLILPDTNIFPEQLGYILAHETTHLKRNDILYKWLVSITKCFHWFNPAIYFISKQVNSDCEISCDMAVVNHLDVKQQMQYIETVLSLLTASNSKPIPLTTGMTGNKKTLKRRFVMIKNRIKVSKKNMVISVISAIIILAASVFASGVLNGYLPDSLVHTDRTDSNEFNILFVGLDNGSRADTVMLIEIGKSSIKGTSIPRDTLIGEKRLIDIYSAENGLQSLIDAVKNKLSVPVHYYTEMNLSAVAEIIDLVGGMNFNVPMDMVYEDPHQNLRINLKEGYHTLTGDAVCQLLQYRPGNSTHGDLSRIYIHQDFIKSFLKQKLNADNINKASEIYKTFSKNINTNLPLEKVIKNKNFYTAVQNGSFTFETIDGICTTYNGIPVYEISDELSFVWPVESKKITHGFGKRVHPITGEEREHNGIDISVAEESSVVASVSGYVSETGYDSVFGNYIATKNDRGIRVYYAHLSEIFVSGGDSVEQGQLIGTVGKTGSATGPNLHFEIQINGEYYNPEKALADYNTYHENIDNTIPTSVITAFFKAFETGDYKTMEKYCTTSCINTHFIKNDYGNVFNVFGMSMATLRSISEPDYLKGERFMGYTVNVSCKTPPSFSILMSKNTFRIFVEKQEDGTYKIFDISY